MRPFALAASLLACACMTPRSVMLGQTAAAVGQGALEIGVGTGLGYAAQSSPPAPSTTVAGEPQQTVRQSHVWAVPAFEGNAHFGLGDHVGINAHFSPAGVQPGLKITLNKSRRANVALMPQVALGYAQYADTLSVTGADGVAHEIAPTSTSMLTFMAGLRFIVSHHSGFFGSVGYDFVTTRTVTTGTTGSGNTVDNFSNLTVSVQHQVLVNLGFSFSVRWLRIRPEIAFAVQPQISTRFSNGASDVQACCGFGWALIPGFSLVAATPRSEKEEGAEEDEKNLPSDEDAPPENQEDQE